MRNTKVYMQSSVLLHIWYTISKYFLHTPLPEKKFTFRQLNQTLYYKMNESPSPNRGRKIMWWSVSEVLCVKMLLYFIYTRILGVLSRPMFKKTHTLNIQMPYTGNSLSEFKFSGNYFEKALYGIKLAGINSFLQAVTLNFLKYIFILFSGE